MDCPFVRTIRVTYFYYTSDEAVETLLTYFGLYLRWLTAPTDRTVILTCGVLLIQRAMKAKVPLGLSIYES
ncbi:hypothetical protein MTR_2g069820 [Medicago truncatula]|uniref:Uncharacterized protein n=1 Tax=Medicago truncatula TaxID=3880 RepID=A0A072VJT6_MEDTR|nr:hypothetical protein MTR_2g069820 [Medicago truncatula]